MVARSQRGFIRAVLLIIKTPVVLAVQLVVRSAARF